MIDVNFNCLNVLPSYYEILHLRIIRHLAVHVCTIYVPYNYIPYRRLFSRGANFPEFPELNLGSGKFMLSSFYY